MNCKNCGAPLVSGQVICSNCDTENVVDNNEQNKAYNDVNQNMVNTSINNFNMVNDNTNYNSQSNETYNAYESDFNETKPKKEKNTILIVLAVVILVPFILLGILALVMVGATNKINSTVKNARVDSFVSEYQMICKQVQQLGVLGENVVCDEDCNMIYEYNNDYYELEVEDLGNYYKITLEIDDDYNVNLSSSDCATLSNVVCSGDEIIGRVYKN